MRRRPRMYDEGRTPNSQFRPEKTWGRTNSREVSKRMIQLCGSPVEVSKLSSRFSTTGRMTTAPISADRVYGYPGRRDDLVQADRRAQLAGGPGVAAEVALR